ncbi:MAG: hypothetical protein PSV16_11490 [Flavobacterium sp.]|nr:hypothetical protein [Flavobacterium sp.]
MEKNKIKQIILLTLIIYCILSILRSSGLLYLAYTDTYFYNFDFNPKLLMQKYPIYNNTYYVFPYLMGVIIAIGLRWIINTNWLSLLLSICAAFILFRFIDSNFIRPIFVVFENSRENILVHLFTFFVILGILIFFSKGVLQKKQL